MGKLFIAESNENYQLPHLIIRLEMWNSNPKQANLIVLQTTHHKADDTLGKESIRLKIPFQVGPTEKVMTFLSCSFSNTLFLVNFKRKTPCVFSCKICWA